MKLKTLIVAIAAAFCALFATGCADSPTDVVDNWRDAILDGDIEEANDYCTDNMHAFNALMIAGIKENEKDDASKNDDFKNMKLVKEEIDGDTAKVWEEGKENPTFFLKKVDSKWKIYKIGMK